MTKVRWLAAPDGAEVASKCRCCGRPIYRGAGSLSRNGTPVADYWYDWSEGHLGLFSLAVRFGQKGQERVVLCNCTCDPAGTKLGVVDPDENWTKMKGLGSILNREHALADPWHPEYFDLFDAVIQFEPRLAPRVKAQEHVA